MHKKLPGRGNRGGHLRPWRQAPLGAALPLLPLLSASESLGCRGCTGVRCQGLLGAHAFAHSLLAVDAVDEAQCPAKGGLAIDGVPAGLSS